MALRDVTSRGIAAQIATRIAHSLLVVIAASTLAWTLMHVAPGDPFSSTHENAPPSLVAEWRAMQGFDRPLGEQYVRWMGGIARGELGWSSSQNRPVAEVIANAMPNTLLLMSLAFAASLAFGVLLGAWQGTRAGSRADRVVSAASLIAYSLPEFWLALALMLLFVNWLHWLPATGMTSDVYDLYSNPVDKLLDRLRHLALPWLSLTIVGTAIFARFQRAAMRESWQQPWVQTMRAKGLTERGVKRHALRAALLPVLTIAGLLFPALLMGAVFVETIFSWPGMGYTLLIAINKRDYLLVASMVIVGSAMTTLGSALADVARAAADPRARTS